MNDTLAAATARSTPFVVVIQVPAVAERPNVIGGVGERIRMLKQVRPGLKAYCRGLAFVVPEATQGANAKVIKAGDKLWGCRTFATVDLGEATAWAQNQLAPDRSGGDA